MKKISISLVALFFVLALAACGQNRLRIKPAQRQLLLEHLQPRHLPKKLH